MRTDHFVNLGQSRRPWLDPEALRDCFHSRSVNEHPDRKGDTAAFAGLNESYAVLRDPVTRLRHLLELEAPETLKTAAEIPAELSDRFLRLATLRRSVDAFTRQSLAADSALAKALAAPERFVLERDLERELARMESARAASLDLVQSLDARWEQRTPELLAGLADLQRQLSFLAKWSAQLRESLFRLQEQAA